MCLFNLLQSQICVSPIEQCTRIIWVQRQGFIVFYERLFVLGVMVKCQGFIVEVCGFVAVKFNCLFEPFKSKVILLVLKVTQTQIVLSRSVVLDNVASP